jgi:hypothetical protein
MPHLLHTHIACLRISCDNLAPIIQTSTVLHQTSTVLHVSKETYYMPKEPYLRRRSLLSALSRLNCSFICATDFSVTLSCV